MHSVYTMSVTLTPINPREATSLEITFLKYDPHWPKIFGLDAWAMIFNNFSAKFSKKLHYTHSTPKRYLSVLSPLGKSYSKYESYP